MPTAITEQITAGSQVQPLRFLSIQSFTLASFIMRGVAALTCLVSLPCIHISRHGNIGPSHLTLWTTAQMLSKEKMYWTLSQQSRGEKQEYTHPARSHTHTWGQFAVSIGLTAPSWKTGSPGETKFLYRTQKPLIKKPEAFLLSARWQPEPKEFRAALHHPQLKDIPEKAYYV